MDKETFYASSSLNKSMIQKSADHGDSLKPRFKRPLPSVKTAPQSRAEKSNQEPRFKKPVFPRDVDERSTQQQYGKKKDMVNASTPNRTEAKTRSNQESRFKKPVSPRDIAERTARPQYGKKKDMVNASTPNRTEAKTRRNDNVFGDDNEVFDIGISANSQHEESRNNSRYYGCTNESTDEESDAETSCPQKRRKRDSMAPLSESGIMDSLFNSSAKAKHGRSAAGKQHRNRKNKLRQQRKKLNQKTKKELEEKDSKIKCLENSVKKNESVIRLLKTKLPKNKYFSSNIVSTSCGKRIALSTKNTCLHGNVQKSREEVLSKVCYIPRFIEDSFAKLKNSTIGSGTFGAVSVVYLKHMKLYVALKEIDSSKSSSKSVLVESIIAVRLSGHRQFPFCFGMFGSHAILFELFGSVNNNIVNTCPTLHKRITDGMDLCELKKDLCQVVDAVMYMHSKSILHNDIKSNNFIVADYVKLIDFGKATLISCPLIYNLKAGSKESELYNTNHRHLAYELRNIPGSKQSILTGTFSVGYLFKHSSLDNSIIRIGRQLKHQNPKMRLCLSKVKCQLMLGQNYDLF